MLGYDVNFGHAVVVQLVGSARYTEKVVGYCALSLLLKPNSPLMSLSVNSIRNDLISSNDDSTTTLALTSVANVAGEELIRSLHVEVQKVLLQPTTTVAVRKKATLCLVRLIRQSSDIISTEEFVGHCVEALQSRSIGALLCTMSLLVSVAGMHREVYRVCLQYVTFIREFVFFF